MKKALIITTISGFLAQFEMNDVKILREMDYEIHYASNFDNPVYELNQDRLDKYKIIRHHICIQKLPTDIKDNVKAYRQLKQLIKQEQFDLIHCHNPMGGVLGRMASGIRGKNLPFVVYTAHGFHFYKGAPKKNWILYYLVERFLACITDVLITVNHEDYVRANSFRTRHKGKVVYIPGVGVDVKKFSLNKSVGIEKRQELGIPKDAFMILSVGELNDNKNHIAIIRALKQIDQKDIFYGICGKGDSEALLKKEIQKNGLDQAVKLFGYRNDIPEILQSADCFAFPSKREGLGIAAIEAMIAGVPMITSDCRGTREYMKHGKNGFVCEASEIRAYAAAIEQLKTHPKLREKMAGECKRSAMNFSIEETDKIMRKMYQELEKA